MGNHKGFLYIRCSKCGNDLGYFAKQETDRFHCYKCGTVTEFKAPLRKMALFHECGANFWYRTNITEPMFDAVCHTCSSPVTVKWDCKHRLYKPVDEVKI